MTRRLLCAVLGLVFLFLAVGAVALADDGPMVVFFKREGCGDCQQMERFLVELQSEYPSMTVRYLEAVEPDVDLMWALAAHYGIFPTSYPVIFVGDEAMVGVGADEEFRLEAAVRDCVQFGCVSPLAQVSAPTVPWRTYFIVGLAALLLLLLYIG